MLGQEPSVPIPLFALDHGSGSMDVADQLFLRLASLGPTMTTAGDKAFVPLLARSWSRRDSVTLIFELDPRARWHDGKPVTARDVVFTFGCARNPKVSPQTATLLRAVASVAAEGERRVVFRFSRAYNEQFYDATYHVAIAPEHLLAAIPPEEWETSDFAKHPVGSGPYRWVRQVPGEFVELAADTTFFLGRPKIGRLFFRFASDPDARLNLLLSGQADVLETVVPPLTNLRRIAADPGLRVILVPSLTVGYVLFNQWSRTDRTRRHPILGDRAVRQALVLALDRESIGRAVYSVYSQVPVGPVSQLLWIRDPSMKPPPYDTATARKLLAARGWTDHDGDGILDKGGRPLSLALAIPSSSGTRRHMGLLAQEQWRRVGIQVELSIMDFPLFIQRRHAGDFDMDISAVTQDPSPSGLVQSWSCAGVSGSNVAGYCDARVDSLIERARFAPGNGLTLWHEVIRTINEDVPAAFLFAPSSATVVRRTVGDVHVRPESWSSAIWRWSVLADRGRG